jgi:hypothetical protein
MDGTGAHSPIPSHQQPAGPPITPPSAKPGFSLWGYGDYLGMKITNILTKDAELAQKIVNKLSIAKISADSLRWFSVAQLKAVDNIIDNKTLNASDKENITRIVSAAIHLTRNEETKIALSQIKSHLEKPLFVRLKEAGQTQAQAKPEAAKITEQQLTFKKDIAELRADVQRLKEGTQEESLSAANNCIRAFCDFYTEKLDLATEAEAAQDPELFTKVENEYNAFMQELVDGGALSDLDQVINDLRTQGFDDDLDQLTQFDKKDFESKNIFEIMVSRFGSLAKIEHSAKEQEKGEPEPPTVLPAPLAQVTPSKFKLPPKPSKGKPAEAIASTEKATTEVSAGQAKVTEKAEDRAPAPTPSLVASANKVEVKPQAQALPVPDVVSAGQAKSPTAASKVPELAVSAEELAALQKTNEAFKDKLNSKLNFIKQEIASFSAAMVAEIPGFDTALVRDYQKKRDERLGSFEKRIKEFGQDLEKLPEGLKELQQKKEKFEVQYAQIQRDSIFIVKQRALAITQYCNEISRTPIWSDKLDKMYYDFGELKYDNPPQVIAWVGKIEKEIIQANAQRAELDARWKVLSEQITSLPNAIILPIISKVNEMLPMLKERKQQVEKSRGSDRLEMQISKMAALTDSVKLILQQRKANIKEYCEKAKSEGNWPSDPELQEAYQEFILLDEGNENFIPKLKGIEGKLIERIAVRATGMAYEEDLETVNTEKIKIEVTKIREKLKALKVDYKLDAQHQYIDNLLRTLDRREEMALDKWDQYGEPAHKRLLNFDIKKVEATLKSIQASSKRATRAPGAGAKSSQRPKGKGRR